MSTDERLYVLTVEAEDLLTIDEAGKTGLLARRGSRCTARARVPSNG
jgi:hypothetical protein